MTSSRPLLAHPLLALAVLALGALPGRPAGAQTVAAPAAAAASAPSAAASAPPQIVLRAREILGRPDLETVAQGEAELRHGDILIRADRLSYDQSTDLAQARGQVVITRGDDRFSGTEAQLHVQTFEGYFLQPQYFFSRTQAGGEAQRIDFVGANRSTLIAATYTSCQRDGTGTPAWLLSTDRVEFDLDANEGRAEGAVLRFYGVPILGAPVLSFPVTDARKSGWLPPSINLDNKSGLDLAVPYYWNIAPNRDATLTPALLTRRGVALQTEFRYLEPSFRGQVDLNMLPGDRVARRDRYATHLRHQGAEFGSLHYAIDALRVSDDAYWKDFPRTLNVITPRLLPLDMRVRQRMARLPGDWTVYAGVRHWQVLQGTDPLERIDAPYQRSPQLGLSGLGRLGFGLEYGLETEVNHFTLPGDSDPVDRFTGTRWHAQAHVSRPWLAPFGWLVPKLAVNLASYETDQAMSDGRRSASRSIPTFSLDGGLVFERDSSWFGVQHRQTLEPRLLYVNTPFRDQASLPNYDSAGKDFNIVSVYSDNAFSGVDRVSDAHQLTAGVTTRLTDMRSGAETLRLGLVQRFLFRDQQVTPEGLPFTRRFSDLLLIAGATLRPEWNLDAALQYSPEISRPIRSVIKARYTPGPFRTISASYRLSRGQSEQFDLGWQWPLTKPATAEAGACRGTLYGVGRVNYSMKDSRITDSLVGAEYDAGCWIGRIVAERLSTGRAEATTRLLFQLELVGLSKLGSNPLKALKDNIPGYRLLRDDGSENLGPFSP